MVLRAPLQDDGIGNPSGLLHPGLPALLLSSQLGGGLRDGRVGGRGTQSHGFCQPRASALNPDAASSSSKPGMESSSSSASSSSRVPSTSKPSIPFPRPPGGAIGLGIGVGGGIFVSAGGLTVRA